MDVLVNRCEEPSFTNGLRPFYIRGKGGQRASNPLAIIIYADKKYTECHDTTDAKQYRTYSRSGGKVLSPFSRGSCVAICSIKKQSCCCSTAP